MDAFTRDELLTICILAGNRADQVECKIAHNETNVDVLEHDAEYARFLHELSHKAEHLSWRTL